QSGASLARSRSWPASQSTQPANSVAHSEQTPFEAAGRWGFSLRGAPVLLCHLSRCKRTDAGANFFLARSQGRIGGICGSDKIQTKEDEVPISQAGAKAPNGGQNLSVRIDVFCRIRSIEAASGD